VVCGVGKAADGSATQGIDAFLDAEAFLGIALGLELIAEAVRSWGGFIAGRAARQKRRAAGHYDIPLGLGGIYQPLKSGTLLLQ
jgi:hypothetical protein